MVTCRRQAQSTILMVMREILSFSPGGIERGQAPSLTADEKGGSEVTGSRGKWGISGARDKNRTGRPLRFRYQAKIRKGHQEKKGVDLGVS